MSSGKIIKLMRKNLGISLREAADLYNDFIAHIIEREKSQLMNEAFVRYTDINLCILEGRVDEFLAFKYKKEE